MSRYIDNELDGEEIEVSTEIKLICDELDSYIRDQANPCREKDIALERLEECAMWATKAVAFHGVKGANTHTVD